MYPWKQAHELIFCGVDCWGRHTHGWSDLLCSSILSLNNKNSPLSSVWSNEMTTSDWKSEIVLTWFHCVKWPEIEVISSTGLGVLLYRFLRSTQPETLVRFYDHIWLLKKPTKWIYFRWPITSFTEVATLCSFCGRHIWNSFGKTLNFGRFQRCEVYTHWPLWSGFWSSLDGDVLHLSVL